MSPIARRWRYWKISNRFSTKCCRGCGNFFAPAYFAIVTRLLDRQLQGEAAILDDWSPEELARMANQARRALSLNNDPRIALTQLEGVLAAPPAAEAFIHRINGD